ncbi:MAG: FHA domain-containing protein [Myxococcales bacterium]
MVTPAAVTKPSDRAKVVVVRGTMPGSAFRLGSVPVGAGSAKGVMLFPEDPYLSPLHATFHFKDGKLFVRDEGGPSGTFVRIKGPEILTSGGQFAIGDHLVRFIGPLVPPATSGPVPYGAPVPPGALFSLEELLEGGRPGRACTRPGPVLSVGRAGCDLTFASDALIQPRQCEVVVDAMGAILRDLSTPDGTYVRMAPGSERSLSPGDMLRFGLQVLRIDAS